MVVWEANLKAKDEHFEDFTLSMLNILVQLQSFAPERRNLVGISRSISVEIRKLLLDGLLRKCVRRPKLHPLTRPQKLVGDPFEQTFEMSASSAIIRKVDDPNRGASALVKFAPMKHTTVIRPLYGLSFQENTNQWISECPFDESSPPIRLGRWLKQPVLQVHAARHNMTDVLSEVANTQGAHSDRQNDTIRQQINEHFRATYLNVFILTVGIYLYNQFSASVSDDSSLRERVAAVHPDIRDETYRVDAILTFERERFSTRGDFILHPLAVTQEFPIVGGIPESGPEPLAETLILTTSEISVPCP